MEYLISADINGKTIEQKIKAINSNQAWSKFRFLNSTFKDKIENISIENL